MVEVSTKGDLKFIPPKAGLISEALQFYQTLPDGFDLNTQEGLYQCIGFKELLPYLSHHNSTTTGADEVLFSLSFA